jgi:Asp-tRNA(Asn)/Glu-tRNA(Gln) amidotransferase A subunit family amidase
MLDNGGIIFGKANMHELAFGITTNNAFYGSCRNPYDVTKHVIYFFFKNLIIKIKFLCD